MIQAGWMLRRLRRGGVSDSMLWARISGAHLPVARDGLTFAEHLAREAAIPAELAEAVEAEYRRFLYLAVLSNDPVQGPPLVQRAWEYHAGLDGYREDFCPWVLGRDDLMPARMPARMPATASYGALFGAYRTEFGAIPPAAIWPDPDAPAPQVADTKAAGSGAGAGLV